MKLKLNHILAAAALLASMAFSAVVFAAPPIGPVYFTQDRFGNTGDTTSSSPYVNQAVTGPTTSVSATCPSDATKILFTPATTQGNFSVKANGTGTPGSSSVTDGNGWANNLADWLDINTKVSGTTISYWAVWTPVSDTVPYICGGK